MYLLTEEGKISAEHFYGMHMHDSDSDSLFTKFYNKESVSKALSIQT